MKTTQERLEDLLRAIASGDGDDDIESVYSAVRDRHRSLEALRADHTMSVIKVGDIVTITSCRPKYLEGLQAKVIDLKKTKALIQVIEHDRPYARRYTSEFLAPFGSLEIIS
jgi:hypothetical protein